MQNRANSASAARYLFLLCLAVIAVSGFAIYLSQERSSATVAGKSNGKDKSFEGGKFEASGVTSVAGTDAILFVDDGKPGEVFWMQLDQNGSQTGGIKAIKLGVNIEDLEGITTDGNYYYVVSSQSRAKTVTQPGIIRFKLDPKSQSVEAVQSMSELKKFLVENVAELQSMGHAKAKDDGINIEGLAWDPRHGRLLLGLRSPLSGESALIVALKLRDPRGPFSYDNFAATETKAIRLPLGGLGIRSIEHDNRSNLFRIIAGATESQEKTDFSLWEWNGDASQPALREVAKLDRKLKPEGVTRASVGDKDFTLIVSDTSRYLRLD